MSRAGTISARNKPESLQALRELVVRLRRDEAEVSLGGKAFEVLVSLVEAPEQAAVRSISELGDLLAVNASTLTRLSKRLGFEGFADFQSVFREAIASDEHHFYSRRAGRLLARKPAPEAADERLAVFQTLAQETARNVDGFMAQLDPATASAAAALLARSRRVRVHGVRQNHAFASFLVYGLGMLRGDVALLDGGLGAAEGLAQLEPQDVVVVASCAPYTRSVAEVAAVAAERGLQVIAVTDAATSPLVPPSRHAFFIPHASSYFSNSLGAYIVFCEGLLNLVARALGADAMSALARREDLIAEMKVEIP